VWCGELAARAGHIRTETRLRRQLFVYGFSRLRPYSSLVDYGISSMAMKRNRQKDPRSTVGRRATPARGYSIWPILPRRLPVQEVARHAQVNVHEADGGRGRQGARTAHGRALAGRPGFWESGRISETRTTFLVTTLLDSLPPSWSVFVGEWKVILDP
jgi:hypothetical protein